MQLEPAPHVPLHAPHVLHPGRRRNPVGPGADEDVVHVVAAREVARQAEQVVLQADGQAEGVFEPAEGGGALGDGPAGLGALDEEEEGEVQHAEAADGEVGVDGGRGDLAEEVLVS